ncbi:MAG: S8 family serine peptidase [Acidobacteriia bacterium]|nr:S8 family serine peptidase [Terriglobia bacterium]
MQPLAEALSGNRTVRSSVLRVRHGRFMMRRAGPTLRTAVALTVCLLAGWLPLAAKAERVARYTVVLDAPGTGKRLSLARGKADRRLPGRVSASSFAVMARAVAATQEPVVTALEAGGATVLGSVHNVLNAVFVRATVAQAEAFESIPGVKSVIPSRDFEVKLDSVADVTGLNAAKLRPSGLAATGEGVKIAIIDSGLDFLHPAFQDDSLPELTGYPKGRPEDLALASRKIVAIRSYMQLQNSGDPASSTPDDNSPVDFSGHGTAVAMVAAGKRVESPAGPLEGIAPRAYLGVYKVTGTPGIKSSASSQALIAAIDDAVVDGMDVLNLSIGQVATHPWNSHGTDCGDLLGNNCDPLAVAAQSAVFDFGRVVVAAAGNSGQIGGQDRPTRNTISSPAVAPDVIAVAATANARQLQQSVQFGGLSYAALTGTGPVLAESLTAPAALAERFENPDACQPFPDGALVGSIVVAKRGGDCWFVDKVEHATSAGAVGVVVLDSEPSGTLVEMGALQDTDIPAYFISASDGSALVQRLSGAAAQLTLDPTPMQRLADATQMAGFSSRGPTPGLNLKPDVAAPGVGVYTADTWLDARPSGFNPSGYRQVQGTSLAAPVIAGGAALVWQRNPTWTAREVASALVNTAAGSVIEDGAMARVGSVGAGLVDLEAALDPIATVEPPTIGFGSFSAASLPVWQEIFITNRSGQAQTYRVAVVARDYDARAAVNLDGFSDIEFRLLPDQYAAVRASLEGLLPAPGSYEGHLLITRNGRPDALRVPFLYVVGDNVPQDAYAIAPVERRGFAGESRTEHLVGKFVDRNGAPVSGQPVEFAVVEGDARILSAERVTDTYGLAVAEVEFGPSATPQAVEAYVGGEKVRFEFTADLLRPRIDEIVNDASHAPGQPVAPGSLATIFGSALAEFAGEALHSPLPVALKSVSVSFDYPELGVSEPARVFLTRSDRLGVQVPWELAGLNFAYAKVRVRTRDGLELAADPFVVNLADVAPGVYVYVTEGESLSAAFYADGRPVTPAAPVAAGDQVTIYLTGAGPYGQELQSGTAAADRSETVHAPVVMVGGVLASVTYSGSVPGIAGMSQIEFVVPAGLPSGNADLAVSMHGAHSNTVSVAVR